MDIKTYGIIKYAIVAIVTVAISYWIFVVMGVSEASSIEITDGKRKFSLTLKSKEGAVSASELLDRILEDKNNSETFFSLLANKGVYRYNDSLLVDSIAELPSDHDVSRKLRELSDSQRGPFLQKQYSAVVYGSNYISQNDSAAVCPNGLFGKYLLINGTKKLVKVYASHRTSDCQYDDIDPNKPIQLLISQDRANELRANNSDTYNVTVTCADPIPVIPTQVVANTGAKP